MVPLFISKKILKSFRNVTFFNIQQFPTLTLAQKLHTLVIFSIVIIKISFNFLF